MCGRGANLGARTKRGADPRGPPSAAHSRLCRTLCPRPSRGVGGVRLPTGRTPPTWTEAQTSAQEGSGGPGAPPPGLRRLSRNLESPEWPSPWTRPAGIWVRRPAPGHSPPPLRFSLPWPAGCLGSGASPEAATAWPVLPPPPSVQPGSGATCGPGPLPWGPSLSAASRWAEKQARCWAGVRTQSYCAKPPKAPGPRRACRPGSPSCTPEGSASPLPCRVQRVEGRRVQGPWAYLV